MDTEIRCFTRPAVEYGEADIQQEFKVEAVSLGTPEARHTSPSAVCQPRSAALA